MMFVNERRHSIIYCLCLLVFLLISHGLLNLVNYVQPTPYLDEVFHVPQAISYCRGKFLEWNPKITTLPGLYLFSVGILKPLSWLFGTDGCGVYALRYINVIAGSINFFLIFGIQGKLRQLKEIGQGKNGNTLQNGRCGTVPSEATKRNNNALSVAKSYSFDQIDSVKKYETKVDVAVFKDLLSALNVAIFPVLYFFTYLYYTDTLSTTFVLLMYWLHLEKCHKLAAATGVISVLVRQTNIIWVGYFTLAALAQVLKRETVSFRKCVSPDMECSFTYVKILLETLLYISKQGLATSVTFITSTLLEIWSYAVVCICFVLFVFINGGITVGDRLAHEAVIHIPQLLYFSVFSIFFCFPYFIVYVKSFLIFIKGHKVQMLILMLLFTQVIYFNTLVHPYLLADNRHYTFYIWKRVYERHFLIKYALIPLYIFGFFCMYQVLKHSKITFQLSYLLCVILCLVPQKLLEFRYFIIPYILFRMEITNRMWWQLLMEFCLFSLVNITTIHLFVTRVFYWSNSIESQRFMW